MGSASTASRDSVGAAALVEAILRVAQRGREQADLQPVGTFGTARPLREEDWMRLVALGYTTFEFPGFNMLELLESEGMVMSMLYEMTPPGPPHPRAPLQTRRNRSRSRSRSTSASRTSHFVAPRSRTAKCYSCRSNCALFCATCRTWAHSRCRCACRAAPDRRLMFDLGSALALTAPLTLLHPHACRWVRYTGYKTEQRRLTTILEHTLMRMTLLRTARIFTQLARPMPMTLTDNEMQSTIYMCDDIGRWLEQHRSGLQPRPPIWDDV
jgi:hypothetical protein